MSAGGRNHVLFDYDAADVVAAEAQAQLADFQSGRDPGRLNTQDIAHGAPRQGEHLQILDGGRFLLDEPAQGSVFALKKPGYEGGKAAGIFLNAPDELE